MKMMRNNANTSTKIPINGHKAPRGSKTQNRIDDQKISLAIFKHYAKSYPN